MANDISMYCILEYQFNLSKEPSMFCYWNTTYLPSSNYCCIEWKTGKLGRYFDSITRPFWRGGSPAYTTITLWYDNTDRLIVCVCECACTCMWICICICMYMYVYVYNVIAVDMFIITWIFTDSLKSAACSDTFNQCLHQNHERFFARILNSIHIPLYLRCCCGSLHSFAHGRQSLCLVQFFAAITELNCGWEENKIPM